MFLYARSTPPISHGSRFGHMKPHVLPGSWINLGPHDNTTAWRILNVRTREERVHYYLWFNESMDHRRDALTNFDRTYLRQLERSSPSSTNVRLTKEARQALQLRELYKNPDTQPEGIVILEGQEIIEYDGRPEQQEGTQKFLGVKIRSRSWPKKSRLVWD